MLKAAGRILNALAWIAVFAITALMIVPFAIEIILNLTWTPGQEKPAWLDTLGEIHITAIWFFFVAWVFFVGSCFASFLNVVALRVPRNESILGASRCPNCRIELKFPTTNIPVLGWLRNGGQCANCDISIPVRYLIVEVVLGLAFLLLFLTQTATGGLTIPFRDVDQFSGVIEFFNSPKHDLLFMLGSHLTLLSLVFTFAIAATEKFKAPITIVFIGICFLWGLQMFNASPGIVDFQFGNLSKGAHEGRFVGMIESPGQFFMAAGLGAIASVVCFQIIRLSGHRFLFGGFASLLLVGISMGWQAVLSVAAIGSAISVASRLQLSSAVFLATLVHLCTWRLQSGLPWWPGPSSGPVQLVCGLAYLVALTAVYQATNSTSPDAKLPQEQCDLPDAGPDLE